MSGVAEHMPEVTGAVTKAAPPLAVTGMTIYGVELSDIVLLATLVYTVIQLVLVTPRLWSLISKPSKKVIKYVISIRKKITKSS